MKTNERTMLAGHLKRAERNVRRGIEEVRRRLSDMEKFLDDPTREEHDRAANAVRLMAETHATCERVSALRLVFNVVTSDIDVVKCSGCGTELAPWADPRGATCQKCS